MKSFKTLIILVALLLPAWASTSTLRSMERVSALQSGSIDLLTHAKFLNRKSRVVHPYEWTQTARLLTTQKPETTTLAISLLESALSESPNDPQAWALLAFLRKQDAGSLSLDAEQALRQSFDTCPYCSKALLRWRFSFVLENWDTASEDTRLSAFSGADFLRWWHLDYAYLKQVRDDARSRGIPFDQYRQKINTPMRPNEIGLKDD